jgi:hypothetical protein
VEATGAGNTSPLSHVFVAPSEQVCLQLQLHESRAGRLSPAPTHLLPSSTRLKIRTTPRPYVQPNPRRMQVAHHQVVAAPAAKSPGDEALHDGEGERPRCPCNSLSFCICSCCSRRPWMYRFCHGGWVGLR